MPPTYPPVVGEWVLQASGTWPNSAAEQEVTFSSVDTRYIWLKALTEVNSNPWSCVAEFNALDSGGLIDRSLWSTWVDSEEITYELDLGEYAIDGNASTLWHTEWWLSSPPVPHSLVIDMGQVESVVGIRELPRSDLSNGRIGNYEIYTFPISGTNPVNNVPMSGTYLPTTSSSSTTLSSLAGGSITVIEGSSPITSVDLSCTSGKGTMTMTASGSAVVTGSGTNAVTIDTTTSETDYNNTLATLAFTGGSGIQEAVTITMLTSDGTLTDSDPIVVFNDITSLRATGTNANIVTGLASVSMRLPSGDSTDTVTITVTDAQALSDSEVITLNAPVPQNPVISNLAGDILAYSVASGAVILDQDTAATVTDADSSDFDTGLLTVSIISGKVPSEDELAIRNEGTGAGQIGVSGSNVTYSGVTIGTFSGGTGDTNLVVVFNAQCDTTAATALVRNITYENTNASTPNTNNRTVRFYILDGDNGTSMNSDMTVTIGSSNTAPVISNLGNDAFVYAKGYGIRKIDQGSDAIVTDADSSDFNGGKLTVSFTNGNDPAEDVITIHDEGAGATNITVGISTVSYGGTQIGTFEGGDFGNGLVVTFNANATPTAVTALIRNIAYLNKDTISPTEQVRVLRFVLTDGDGGTSDNYDTTISVILAIPTLPYVVYAKDTTRVLARRELLKVYSRSDKPGSVERSTGHGHTVS